ncbi:ROK family protein [Neobacillus muris]|uniref:ROK family protein n=1 Tax=Neobacillus muris TaxID=2941334 RepID=UPI0020421571|nr:ROK family protein [Neobacillus muris]
MHTIGVDIGGTKVKAGIVNHGGTITTHLEEQTNKLNLMNQVFDLIGQLLNGNLKIAGIGIATAGRVNVGKGTIHYATSNLPGWAGTRVKEQIEERFQLPAIVDNDANCAAFAEMEVGAAKKVKNLICITLGTGVGAGIILNGQLHRGEIGGAGEIGHMIYMPNGRPCNCGKKGCWEQYVSGTALEMDIKEYGGSFAENLRPKELFRLANEGHPAAIQIVDRFLANLANGMVSLQSILDVECFVMGGGVIQSSHYWWDFFIRKLQAITDQPLLVRKARLENDAGMIGAGLMARKYVSIADRRKG